MAARLSGVGVGLLRNPGFSTPALGSMLTRSEGEWETRAWICPECQRLRQQWVAANT